MAPRLESADCDTSEMISPGAVSCIAWLGVGATGECRLARLRCALRRNKCVGVLTGGNPPLVLLLGRNDRDDSTARSSDLAFFIDLTSEFPSEMNHCDIWTNEPYCSACRCEGRRLE